MKHKDTEPILSIQGLEKSFPVRGRRRSRGSKAMIKAVNGVDLFINEGETLGLVGESGCGKTTVGRLILRLIEPTKGALVFREQDISNLIGPELLAYRQQVQIIFQDPFSSLNPRMCIGNAISEPLISHGLMGKEKARERAIELLSFMGLSPQYYYRYPHEFSGGQRQRIGIARALALQPKLIVADEPVSALDVSIQAQVINLMEEIREKFGITYLFISHDLGVVRHISDRVAVMYLGKIVELSETEELFEKPMHPYTEALLNAVPVSHPRLRKERFLLKGDVPSLLHSPSGCTFHPRCPRRIDRCEREIPRIEEVSPHHVVACHLVKGQ